MTKIKTTHKFIVTIVTDKDMPDLTDLFANRIYSMDGVHDVTVSEMVDGAEWVANKLATQ